MTLLKHEPSAQIPWQKTMLGFPELLTFETSPAFAAGTNSVKNEAPSNAELVDRNPRSVDAAWCTHDELSLHAADTPYHPRPYLSEDL
ncbi:MAG: hypothetical protein WBE35_04810, partial [Candidatus Cybelea sp.]